MRTVPIRPDGPSLLLLLLALAAWLPGCGGSPPLAFTPHKIKVGHDAAAILDAALLDPDHDGDMDLLVATEDDLRYLLDEDGAWIDGSLGTGLQDVAPVQRLIPDGMDFVIERDGVLSRLVYSGIGSWTEAPGPVPDVAPEPVLAVEADLDGDGRPDRARVEGRAVVIELRAADGTLRDVTRATGADGLLLPAPARRLLAADIENDGDVDLLVVGGRIFALLNSGGRLAPGGEDAPAEAGLAGGAPVAAARADGGASGTPAPTAPETPWFTDVAAQAGLDFVHVEGDEQWDIRPTMGPGAAWDDVDGDGDDDLYVVGGTGQSGRLYLNDGAPEHRLRFTDGTAAWGLDTDLGAGMGCLFADLDDDGDAELYVTNDGPNVLLRHDDHAFVDVTASSGTGDDRWGASVACADVDRDGDLDLYVTNYLEFDASYLPDEADAAAFRREDPLAMLPYVFPGQANVLYRNDGGLHFTDVTEEAGLLAPDGKSMGALFLDQDDDGWPDLCVANDTTPNTFWHNQGDGSFEEVALFLGMDDPRGGMGMGAADVDDDGDEDLFIANWQLEPNALFRNNRLHRPTNRRFIPGFEDVAVQAGLAQLSVGYVGWGCCLADLDGDGDHDLYIANGYTSPDYETSLQCTGQVDLLLENVTAPGSLTTHKDVPRWERVTGPRAGPALELAHVSRGLAAADPDQDGDLDLLIAANNGPLVLLRNDAGGRFLRVVPEGRGPRCNRDAAGARVTLSLDDGGERVACVRRSGSYLSGHERGVRFGLGAATPVAVRVDWPDGTTSTHPVTAPGTLHVVQPGPGR